MEAEVEIDLEYVVGGGTACCDKFLIAADAAVVAVAGGEDSLALDHNSGKNVDAGENGVRNQRRHFVSNVDTQMEENSSCCCRLVPLFRLRSGCHDYRKNSFCFRFANSKSFVGRDCHLTSENPFAAAVGSLTKFRRGNFEASNSAPGRAKSGFVFPTTTETSARPIHAEAGAQPRPRSLFPGMFAHKNLYRRWSSLEAVVEILDW